MDFNKLLNEYSVTDINERMENLAAAISNTPSLDWPSISSNYLKLEKKDGTPSAVSAEKDIRDLVQAMVRKKELINNKEFKFDIIKKAVMKKLSVNPNSLGAGYKDFGFDIAKELNGEKSIAKSTDKAAEKPIEDISTAIPDGIVPEKMIAKIGQDIVANAPEFEIEFDEFEYENMSLFKKQLINSTKGIADVENKRGAGSEEKNSLTHNLKNKISEIIAREIKDVELIKKLNSNKNWSSLILSALESYKHILTDENIIKEVKTYLDDLITKSVMKKNDFVLKSKRMGKKLPIEVKSFKNTNLSKVNVKILDLAILSTHNKGETALQGVLGRKGISPEKYKILVKDLYNSYIISLSTRRTVTLPRAIYIYNPSDEQNLDKLLKVTEIIIASTGGASKYIRVYTSKKEFVGISEVLEGEGVV